ncbi:hypothetical protein [Croceicoccus mobilis]|uniref:Flagellar protein FlbD n=1 Tax=Croceicoccus mobilis TaxID=1703339 RepID=A0A916YUZ2_9SPHN|nr:hypothetical protein [Croceicoccus mobilis]GGD62385.1 hypothetical protein GCM10010990_09750 [Croceicoccus mobilis]
MFVKFTATDRVAVIVNATQVTYISEVSEGTRIRFGENRSVTVLEPLPEVMDRLDHTEQLPAGYA